MSHFNLKSFMFYGVAIGFVAVLFKAVTVYGETHLQASPPISGRYRFSGQNLPGCLKSEELVLTIQQSGIYLNASLFPGNGSGKSEKTTEKKPSLFGKWQNKKLILAGSLPHILACDRSEFQDKNSKILVKIEGAIEGDKLKGNIHLNSSSDAVDFTAQKEVPMKQQKKEH